MRNVRSTVLAVAAAGMLAVVFAGEAKAQVYVGPAPVVSYYAAPAYYAAPVPPVSYYVAPTTYVAPVAPAPVVSYYAPAPVSYYAPAPVVSYYGPVVYPARVSTGLFGRTTVRTPFYKVKY